ncbi:unnamed protein product [Rotaria sp. Silwood2]|nr:unnamed protein product [Rotaria sp. Silwood2]CAF3969857.1 unnamed protein product [Rotaria sp. Silwood2]CAF4198644.1 unnamed protein product [Rotaria sp. Silwood2]
MESTNNHQFIAFSPIVVHQYRRRSIPTIITDDHINGILEKLGSSKQDLTTEQLSTFTSTTETSSRLFTIETSTSTNQTSSVSLFQTKRLPIDPDVVAPDGSLVRNLLTTIGGSMAQFDLPPGMTSNAVEHRTVYEIWYFLSGQGEFWRKQKEIEEIVTVDTNVCITIPVGTQFQFRTIGRKPLIAVAITMPPWPGENEAMPRKGIWNATFIGLPNSSTKLLNSIYLWMIILTLQIAKTL